MLANTHAVDTWLKNRYLVKKQMVLLVQCYNKLSVASVNCQQYLSQLLFIKTGVHMSRSSTLVTESRIFIAKLACRV